MSFRYRIKADGRAIVYFALIPLFAYMPRRLPRTLPFRDIWNEFIAEYSQCTTYWYVPHTRALNDDNVGVIQAILGVIFEEFLDHKWSPETQNEILVRLREQNIVDPYRPDGTFMDRAALVRIWKKFLETLGFLYVRDDKEIVITDAGLGMLVAEDKPSVVVETQIARYQYPNPVVAGPYGGDFPGILPHLFLLQVLRETDDRLSVDEFDLFVNLSREHSDLSRIVRYVKTWRDLGLAERQSIMQTVERIPMRTDRQERLFADGPALPRRYRRIKNVSAYARAFFTYASYLALNTEDEDAAITCSQPAVVRQLVEQSTSDLKISAFDSLESWIAYYGDPKQRPTWYTFLVAEIEQANDQRDVARVLEEHKVEVERRLTPEERKDIQRREVEKAIETFYAGQLDLIEAGLKLVDDGRQYGTPIGRLDLLCRAATGEYVVVEFKADEADDSVMGQILRYIGWVYRNLADGKDNVRGFVVASTFPEKVRYARIGMLRKDHGKFIGFKEHGLDLSTL